MSKPTGLSRLSQIAMTVRDSQRAVKFYRDTLGVPLLFEAPPNFAFFDLDGIRLMLAPPEGEFAPPGSVLYFNVDDIRQAHQELAARGVVQERTAPRRQLPVARSAGRLREARQHAA